MSDTRKELVTILKQAFVSESDIGKKRTIQTIITRAEMGYYHDFKSTIAFPKMQLVRDLEIVGLFDISNKVKNGEFDESPDEDDKKQIEEDLKG